MPLINDNYLKLAGGYLFPEIGRRIDAFVAEHPDAADKIIHCGIGDVTEPLPPAVVEAVCKATEEMGRADGIHGYGPGTGYADVRATIADNDFDGLGISAEEIFLSDGSKGDCGHILEILGAGNTIAVTDPVYPVYVDTNVMVGNTGPARPEGGYEGILYLPATPDNGFVAEPPSEKVDLVYLCFPNNPTGSMITGQQLRAWVDYALQHDALILYDVAYQAFITEPHLPRSIYEIDDARRCAIEFHSFSKNGGFTGLRCGYTACPKTVEGTTAAGQRVPLHDLWERRWNTRSNGVPYPVQRGAQALYSPEGREQTRALVEGYLANARVLREGCETLGWRVWGGVNAPYVWVGCPDGVSSWDMFDKLLHEAHIVTTPGAGFGACGEGFFRISAFNSRANVETVVDRLRALMPAKTNA